MARDGNPRLQLRLPKDDRQALDAALKAARLSAREFLLRLAKGLRESLAAALDSGSPETGGDPAGVLVDGARLTVWRAQLLEECRELLRRRRHHEAMAAEAERRLRQAREEIIARHVLAGLEARPVLAPSSRGTGW